MIAFVAHSLGRNGDVGVRSTARKSSRLRNPSGRASRSGRMSRSRRIKPAAAPSAMIDKRSRVRRSEEHTSELQSRVDLVCRLLLEKKKKKQIKRHKSE